MAIVSAQDPSSVHRRRERETRQILFDGDRIARSRMLIAADGINSHRRETCRSSTTLVSSAAAVEHHITSHDRQLHHDNETIQSPAYNAGGTYFARHGTIALSPAAPIAAQTTKHIFFGTGSNRFLVFRIQTRSDYATPR